MTRITYRDRTTDRSDGWRDDAACATVDPELFFPKPGDSRGAAHARFICASCPVRQKCLDDILAAEGGRRADSRHGIVGGKSGKQRYLLHIKRRNNRQAAA